MAEEAAAPEQKSGGKGLMIALIALVVILLLAVGGLAYFILTGGLNQESSSNEKQEVHKEEASKTGETFKTSIDDLVLNITNSRGREKLMKLSFSIKSTEPTIAAIIEEYKPEIVDIVISQISARSSEELLTVGGKALLKEELIEEINNVVNEVTASNEDIKKNSVQQIYFTSFVIK